MVCPSTRPSPSGKGQEAERKRAVGVAWNAGVWTGKVVRGVCLDVGWRKSVGARLDRKTTKTTRIILTTAKMSARPQWGDRFGGEGGGSSGGKGGGFKGCDGRHTDEYS
jgi:hypothetical protein